MASAELSEMDGGGQSCQQGELLHWKMSFRLVTNFQSVQRFVYVHWRLASFSSVPLRLFNANLDQLD